MSPLSGLIDTFYIGSSALSVLTPCTHSTPGVSSNSSFDTAKTTPQDKNADSVNLSDASKTALTASQVTVADPFAGKTQAQLQAIRSDVMHELSQSDGVAGIAKDALQVPVPATPARLASAQMATTHVNSGGQTQNPFAGLSRSALTAIIYDQSGTYTINERSAALGQQEDNDTAFLTSAHNQTVATGSRSFIYTALQELNQQQLPVEKAVPDEFIALSTSPEQLNDLLDLAGGPANLLLGYPGGWTPSTATTTGALTQQS